MNKAAHILAKRQSKPTFSLETFLFKEQLDFVRDPSRFAVAVCSTRAGKTVSCAADLVNTALGMPGTTGLYITLARSSAERIVWPELKRINRDYKLGGRVNEIKLTMKFPNSSNIYLMGANDENEIEKVRGLSNVALVYLDECQAFRAHIKTLVEDIVAKRLYDTNGRCRLIGTPGPVLSGYFYECSLSTKWSNHHWTMFQNPWLFRKSGKTPQELTQQDCDVRGVTAEHPSIQRENFGRWVYDKESLLLQYDPQVNDYQELPTWEWRYILGIDFGHKDSDSLSLLGFSKNGVETYLVEEIVKSKQTTDELAQQIKRLCDKYPISDMVADTGGLGLKIAEDLKQRYGLPIEAADKREKMTNYRILDGALRRGIFKAKQGSRFAQDCNLLERDLNRSTPDRIVVRGHSDAIDSALYAFKLSPAYSYVPPKQGPTPGTEAYIKMQEELHVKAAMEKVKKEKDALAQTGNQYGTWNKDKKGVPDWNKW